MRARTPAWTAIDQRARLVHDNADTVLNEWALAWAAYQAVTSPLHLFRRDAERLAAIPTLREVASDRGVTRFRVDRRR